jgi:prolipoprotein diacylglyceryltransferase
VRPVLWQWRGITIRSYVALLYLGLVCGVLAGDLAARAAGLDARRVYVATLVLLVPALVGARLLFVVTHWDRYRREPARIWRRSEGGAAMYGGLVLSLAVSVPVLAAARLPFGPFWDVATFTMLVGLVSTRVGCLLHGCCGGRLTNGALGMSLPGPDGVVRRRVPTQLLEMAWGALLLATAAAFSRRAPFPGGVFVSVVVAYALGRIALELGRDPVDRRGRVVTLALSALFALVGLVAIVLRGGAAAVGGAAYG